MTAPTLDPVALRALAEDALDERLRAFAAEHGAGALPALTALAAEGADRVLRRAARRALYRLSQKGVTPPRPAPKPVIERQGEQAVRAWISGIDGTGSRAAWIVFESALGGTALCSLIVNDTVGIADVAGGEITKKRLESELASLRASQKLPWVETDPTRVVGIVAGALDLHGRAGTSPPGAFARWRHLFEGATPPTEPELPAADPLLVERSGELLELPELAGWFLDPEAVQVDAVELLAARESRLVVSDQIKTEREAAIVDRVIERELGSDTCRRWARRLAEMALVFDSTGRGEPAALARAAAAALADSARDPRRHPFAQGLARRALEIAGEVASGRIKAADVSRRPGA